MPDVSLLKNQVPQLRVLELVKCHSRRAIEFRAAFYLAISEEDLGVYLEEMPKVFLEVKRLLDAGGAAASLEAVMAGVLGAPERVKMVEGVRGRIARWRSGVTATKTERTLAFQAEEARVRESRVAESIVDDSLVGGLSRLAAPTGAVMGSDVARGSGSSGGVFAEKRKVKGSVFTAEVGAARAQAAGTVGAVKPVAKPAAVTKPATTANVTKPAITTKLAVVKPLEVTEVPVEGSGSVGDLEASGPGGEIRIPSGEARGEARGNLGSKFEDLLGRFEAQSSRLEAQSAELSELRAHVKAQDSKLEELSAALGVLSPDANLARVGVRELMALRESVKIDTAELRAARAEVTARHSEVLESRDVVVAQRIRLVNTESFHLAILEVFYSVSVGWETLVEESRLLRLCVARVENRVDQSFALAASSRLWIKNEAVKVLREAGFKVRHPNEWTTGSPKENEQRRRQALMTGGKALTPALSNQKVMLPKLLSADESIDLSVVQLPLPMLDSVEGISSDELRARENIALRHLRLGHLGSVVMNYAEQKFSKNELSRAVELQLEVARRVVSERALYLTSGNVTETELGWALDGAALVAEGVMPPGETVDMRLETQREYEALRAILVSPKPVIAGADPGEPSAGVLLDPAWVSKMLASPDAVDASLEGGSEALFGSGSAMVTTVRSAVTAEGVAVTGGAVQRHVDTAVLEIDGAQPELVTEPLEVEVYKAEVVRLERLEARVLEAEMLEAEELQSEPLEAEPFEADWDIPPVSSFDEDVAVGRRALNESRVDSRRDDDINAW